MSENKVNETVWNLAENLQEVGQTVVESAVAAQGRNIKFAQSTIVNGIGVLKSHAEETRALTQELLKQSQKQSEALQTLAHESLDAYINFLYAPFSYYQQVLETTESIAWQGLETAQRIARSGLEAGQKATRQGQKSATK